MFRLTASFLTAAIIGFLPARAVDAASLSLERYFKGSTVATGSFTAINGVQRTFTVNLNGKWDGKTLVLVEDFRYADGERDRKTWRFRKITDNRYTGTREDVVGETTVTIRGDTAKFTYLVDIPASGKVMRVRFHDRMVLKPDGTLVNNALVTRWALPVAWTKVVFHRK